VKKQLRWWHEVLFVLAFYFVYSLIRNKGLNPNSELQAFHNAKRVIRVEQFLHSFHEAWLQQLFYPSAKWFIWFWDVFYGSAHFIVTIVAIVLLFRRQPARYPLWRTTLACTTALALIGFAFFPLMPPRLLPSSYDFVDTLRVVGGLWSFDSGTMQKVSNQYAAMPSLHFGWSTWCACVLYPMAHKRWLRVLVLLYPLMTLFAIVVTANHFWLDAAGGALVLGAGYLVARTVHGADVDSLPDSLESSAASAAEVDTGDNTTDGGSHVGGGQDLTAPR
jgi:hypothetical protein